MKNPWVLQFLVALCIVDCARAASPALTIPQPTLSVGEKEAKRTILTEGTNYITCTDADGELTRAYISSMNPSTPCAGCFALEICGGNTPPTDYCLTYQPSQGKFVFTQVDNYRVAIVCTDDTADPAATGTVEVAVVKNQQPVFTTPGFGQYLVLCFCLSVGWKLSGVEVEAGGGGIGGKCV
ncbi:hypothetical protein V1264_009027 [Littorina saxatilis]|uniref:Uncharacterized protein n=1 Tax=Littorina saxatilis TaxID=31220 RepID=A0AAN9AQU1_9CAEN